MIIALAAIVAVALGFAVLIGGIANNLAKVTRQLDTLTASLDQQAGATGYTGRQVLRGENRRHRTA